MSQINKKLVVIGFILVVIMGISGMYALAVGGSDQGDASQGYIDIKINEYMLNENNEEVAYNEKNTIVDLGEEVSLIEKVKNLGDECYIRAYIKMEGLNTEESVQGIPGAWQKIGDYYYYRDKVETGEEIKIFDTIKIPTNTDIQLMLTVKVDAVQARNFEPNFKSQDPWNGTEIEKRIYNDYVIDENAGKLTIELKDGADRYLTVPDDFARDLRAILPGDTVKKQIKVKNTDKEKAELFVQVDISGVREEQKRLLKDVWVKITNKNGNVIYEGDLSKLVEKTALGEYKYNEEDVLTVEVSLPKGAQNIYEGILRNVKWSFSAKTTDLARRSIKTGDFEFDLSLVLFFTSAIMLIVVLTLINIERKKNKKSN